MIVELLKTPSPAHGMVEFLTTIKSLASWQVMNFVWTEKKITFKIDQLLNVPADKYVQCGCKNI